MIDEKEIHKILEAYRNGESSAIPDVIIMPEECGRQLCKEAGLTPEETDAFINDHVIDLEDDNESI